MIPLGHQLHYTVAFRVLAIVPIVYCILQSLNVISEWQTHAIRHRNSHETPPLQYYDHVIEGLQCALHNVWLGLKTLNRLYSSHNFESMTYSTVKRIMRTAVCMCYNISCKENWTTGAWSMQWKCQYGNNLEIHTYTQYHTVQKYLHTYYYNYN